MLAFHLDEVVPSDVLLDGLWGEQPPASTANTVQVHVSWLRVPLPHVVATQTRQCFVAVILEVIFGPGRPFLTAAHVRTVVVAEADHQELQRRARSKGAPAREVERARIVLLAGDGVPGK